MQETRIIMGMLILIAVADEPAKKVLETGFTIFSDVDARFSTYRADSEISRFNNGSLREEDGSREMREVFALARLTEIESDGYFNMMRPDGLCDPSGVVKSWAIKRVAEYFRGMGLKNFLIDAGGDVQTCGVSGDNSPWRVGIRNPFSLGEIIKVLQPQDCGVATSGTSVRGSHIWNPHAPAKKLDEVVSITVIGPDVLEADRFATAAFAMGRDGVHFIESLAGLEAYQVNALGEATLTRGFRKFEVQP